MGDREGTASDETRGVSVGATDFDGTMGVLCRGAAKRKRPHTDGQARTLDWALAIAVWSPITPLRDAARCGGGLDPSLMTVFGQKRKQIFTGKEGEIKLHCYSSRRRRDRPSLDKRFLRRSRAQVVRRDLVAAHQRVLRVLRVAQATRLALRDARRFASNHQVVLRLHF